LKTSTGKRASISRIDRIFIPACSAKLTRTHKLIRIEKEKEIIFMKICSQIHLDDFKKNRSKCQREERRLKRVTNPHQRLTAN
jgi:hypothetical protein